MSTQKGQALIFIILALVAAGFVGIMFYVGKITPKPPPEVVTLTPSPTPSPSPIDETASWKTYTNTKYGFSFKYPNSDNWRLMNLPNPITNEDNTFLVECNNRCTDKENITSFQVSLSSFKSLKEYLSEASKPKESTSPEQPISDYKYIDFHGEQAVEAVDPGFCPKGKEDRCENSSIDIFIISNNQGFILKQYFKELSNLTKLDEFPAPNPDILPTFKFLK